VSTTELVVRFTGDDHAESLVLRHAECVIEKHARRFGHEIVHGIDRQRNRLQELVSGQQFLVVF
jgi:hypothetical protein